mmetsp:Transcript_22702/g.37534  ORF Transcript_22702/g.37534 Transcript_22702/m.37534 type:complete len:447 (-) Transcript_22702:297-1637(-)
MPHRLTPHTTHQRNARTSLRDSSSSGDPSIRLNFKLNQYESSACNGLGTAGNVCPTILRCAVQGTVRSPGTRCAVRPLSGFGFNPSITPTTPEISAMLPPQYRTPQYEALSYFALTRFESNNEKVRCRNPYVRGSSMRSTYSSTELLLLARDFRVLARLKVTGGICARGRWRVVDSRLVPAADGLWMNYKNHFGEDGCKGYWLGKLNLSSATTRMLAERQAKSLTQVRTSLVTLWPTDGVGGVGLDGERGSTLYAERNGGIGVQDGQIWFELADVAPLTKVHMRSGLTHSHHAPSSFAADMHNSINPVWMPELKAYLGIAHRHYRSGFVRLANGMETRDKNSPFQFGYAYRHVFFTLTARQYRIERYSREICFPSIEAAAYNTSLFPNGLCEGIQFAMSAFRMDDESTHGPTIAISYGLMDCQSALLTLSLHKLQALLEFTNEQPM